MTTTRRMISGTIQTRAEAEVMKTAARRLTTAGAHGERAMVHIPRGWATVETMSWAYDGATMTWAAVVTTGIIRRGAWQEAPCEADDAAMAQCVNASIRSAISAERATIADRKRRGL